MALPLYLATTLALLWFWSWKIQPISRGAALALILLPMLFTGRALLTGRVYAPIDLPFQFEPLHSHARELGIGAPHDIRLSDLHTQMIPWQKAVRSALAQGEWPLWNPFTLCGDILAAAAQPAVYDPFHLLGMLIPLPQALTYGASMTFFLAAFFAFAMARKLGCDEVPGLLGAGAYAFCAMLAFYAGWPLGRAWAVFPLILFGTHRVVHERKAGVLLAGLVLVIVAGHPESVLHAVTVGVAYGVFEVIRLRAWRAILPAAGTGVLALALTAIYLLPFIEAVPQTVEYDVRAKIYGVIDYKDVITPAAQALRIRQTFVPFQDADPLSTRAGYLVMALALVAVIARRGAHTWFFLTLAVVGFLVTCGIPPLPHLLHELPLFNIAINERLSFPASLALALLAAMGAQVFVGKRVVPMILLALVLAERAFEDGGTYPTLPQEAFYPPVPPLDSIPRGDGRIAGVGVTFVPNAATLYGLEDVRGYQAMTNRRRAQTYPLWSRQLPVYFNLVEDPSRPFLSFLNVRWILDGTSASENRKALPRAFVPRRIRYERDGAEVLKAMGAATDFADVAWIETPDYEPHDVSNGTGQVIARRDGLAWDLDVTMEHAGWVVISETAWEGWRAYVDGRRVRPLHANHAFLGVHVDGGRHQVRLVYLPESFTRGRAISLSALGVLIAATIARACLRSRSTSSPPPF
jgi:hypothetical protein